MRAKQFVEKDATVANGMFGLVAGLVLLVLGAFGFLSGFSRGGLNFPLLLAGGVVGSLGLLLLSGVYALSPNQCALFTLFGQYVGSDRTDGLRWANPFYAVTKVDMRTRTLETPTLKVNDERGNPIEVAAMAVWRVEDAAASRFGLRDVDGFLKSTFDSALREIVSRHPYDHADRDDPKETTLRGHVAQIAEELRELLRHRINESGGAIAIDDCKLTHLAYAPEIASAMLRRQQAEAVISARKKIVQGAVEMVDEALRGLADKGIVVPDGQKAVMVGNLLVVLCSERETQPVIATS